MKIINVTRNAQHRLKQMPSAIYLGIAVCVFAAANPITRRIVTIGNQYLVDGRNPISLCNVLFVGNICALGLMLCIFHRDWHRQNLQALTAKDWLSLTITAILSGAIAPALIFYALGVTNIANIVLIGRIEPILTLILSAWLWSAPINPWLIAGSVISFAGIATTALLTSSPQKLAMGGLQLGIGEISVALAAIITSISTIVNKMQLRAIPVGIFMVYRNIVGSLTFFVVANILYGPIHFIDAFSPLLWQWMLVYALLIVLFGQLCWLTALKRATITELNLASLCNPIIAIAMAYLILGEVPTQAQYIGGSLLLLGLLISFIGNLRPHKPNQPSSTIKITPIKAMEIVVGFKGM